MFTKLNVVFVFVLTSVCLSLVTSPAASLSFFHLGKYRCADRWSQLGYPCLIRVPESHMRLSDTADSFCRRIKKRLILLHSMACSNTDHWQDKDEISFKDGMAQKRVMGNNGM